MELEYEDLVITTDEINHEDFPNNLTEEQRIVGRFYLPIMKEFGIWIGFLVKEIRFRS